jgi:hypothetical protein
MRARPWHLPLAFIALAVAGCGGDVIDSRLTGEEPGDGGLPDGAASTGSSVLTNPGGPSGSDVTAPSSRTSAPPSRPRTQPSGVTCGNGRLERDEECDGALLNAETCATATMNAAPTGELRCSPSCVFDVSGCFVGARPYPGGSIGGGGVYGGGGTYGGPRPPVRRRPPPGYGGSLGYYYPPPPPPNAPYPYPYPPTPVPSPYPPYPMTAAGGAAPAPTAR